MSEVLYGGTPTTEAVHRALRHSQESLRTLVCRHGINPRRWTFQHGWGPTSRHGDNQTSGNDRFSLSSRI